MVELLLPFHLFDPRADVAVVHRRLPHWSQEGAICFITWRTNDSMPKEVVSRWISDRARWLRAHEIDIDDADWRSALTRLDRREVNAFLETFWNRWHDSLDSCHGECVLRAANLNQIVANSLLAFDGDRYSLFDFVVMPNHVHVLASFESEKTMLLQCESWKHYTARHINRALNRKGRFWQQDAFDHLVRSEEQFEYLRRYIAGNPAKASLQAGEYAHYSKPIAL